MLNGDDAFFSPDAVSKLAALHYVICRPTPSFSDSPSLTEATLPRLISPQTIALLTANDWLKSIGQEVSDIAEHLLASHDVSSVSDAERLQLQAAYCKHCYECAIFGMEFWQVTCKSLLLGRNGTGSKTAGAAASAAASQPSSAASASTSSSSSSSAAAASPLVTVSLMRGKPLQDEEHKTADVAENDSLLIGVNQNGISIVVATDSPSRQAADSPPYYKILTWDLFSIKCWSYSKTLFTWTELNTEVEYAVRTPAGYILSGLLMDYALNVVQEKGADPPCLKHQSLDQLAWKGTIVLDEGRLVNSLKAAPQRPKSSASDGALSALSLRKPSLNGDVYPEEPPAPFMIRKTTDSITVSWDPPASDEKIVRYEIKYSVRFAFGWDTAPIISHNDFKEGRELTCKITGLQKDTSYVFTMRCMNDRGFWSNLSDVSEPFTTKKEDYVEPTHLVVLSHGICANDTQTLYLKEQLEKIKGGDLAVLCATSNAGIGCTRDGINIGGHRLALEIVEFAKRNPDINKISMIGHNIGGLYCRYAAGALYANGLFKALQPVNFITLATPHLGSGGTILSDDVASVLLGDTGEQLSCVDGFATGEEPMLLKICHRQFLQALLHFPNRVLYSNITPDGRVSLCSGSIREVNPYEGANEVALQRAALRAYPSIILGELWEPGEHEATDSTNEATLVNAGSPARPRKSTVDEDNLKLDQIQKFRKDMYESLNEVGWRRRDIVNMGHDDLLQDPQWWLTDRSGKNVVVDHLCMHFLLGVAGQPATSREDGKMELDSDVEESQVEDASKAGNLELHPNTGLFFFPP